MKLTQQAPKPGQPTPYETHVQVIVTGDGIYFGFTCKDPDPRHIAIHTMQRDGDLLGDDTVSIVLDTYSGPSHGILLPDQCSRDTRRWFDFNCRQRLSRLGRHLGCADGKDTRWLVAEIVIPSRTLSFTPGLNDWGLNLERFVPRERLWLRWSSPTLDSFLYADLSRAGRLTGVGEVKQGKGLEITPYAIGKTEAIHGAGSSRSWQEQSCSVTWKITPQLVTVFTANTDFAELS